MSLNTVLITILILFRKLILLKTRKLINLPYYLSRHEIRISLLHCIFIRSLLTKIQKVVTNQFVEEFKVADFTGHKLAPFIYPSGADVLYYLGHFNYDDSVVNSLNILRKSTCSSKFVG